MAKEGLILTGFMGMGKSTVGPAVAERLAIGYTDTDAWLREAGHNITWLVDNDMDEFRRLETEALLTILGKEPSVVSTGGGIVSTVIGRSALLSVDVPVVLLAAPFEVAAEHVAKDPSNARPLFRNVDDARVLFEERQPWYRQTATHVVDAAQPKEQVVADIVAAVS